MSRETSFQPTTAATCHSAVKSLLTAASSRPVKSARALYAKALMAKLLTTTKGRRRKDGRREGAGTGSSVGSMAAAAEGWWAKSRVLTSALNWSSGRRARKGTWDDIDMERERIVSFARACGSRQACWWSALKSDVAAPFPGQSLIHLGLAAKLHHFTSCTR